MPRPLDTERRAELLAGTIAYASRHGVAALSLRPLAAELGTSARMLVHYFGSKEELLGQALEHARPDLPRVLARHAEAGDLPAQMAIGLWRDLTRGGEQEARTRLLLEVLALAMTQPEAYGPYAAAAVRGWVEPLAGAYRRSGREAREARARATLLVDGLRGLALDRYVTGDVRRTDDAAARLIEAVTAPRAARRGGRR